jgi:hypothetical protein
MRSPSRDYRSCGARARRKRRNTPWESPYRARRSSISSWHNDAVAREEGEQIPPVGRNNWFAIQADEGLSNEVAALVVFSHPAVITVPVEYGLAGEAPKYVVESPYRARHTSSTFSPSRSVGARPGLGRIRASRPADSDRQQDRPLDFCSKCNLQ